MKRSPIIFCLVFLWYLSTAQSFHRGALVMDLNTGIEFYNTSLNYKVNRLGQNSDTSVVSQAGNANVSLGLEVGLSKRLGIGVRGKANSFFSDVDNVTSKSTQITSTELVLMINVHPVVLKKLDIVLGADAGFSGFDVKLDDLQHTRLDGNGTFFSFYLNPRVYLGRFGFNLKAYMPFVNYGSLESNSSNLDKYIMSKWKGNGFGVSLGIQLRLF